MLRIEGVLHLDGNVLHADGINRRRINHLGTEVTELHRLDIRQLVDGIGRLDDAWVGCHETVHIRPYLQHLSVNGSCNDGCGIVRTTAPQVRRFARVAVS